MGICESTAASKPGPPPPPPYNEPPRLERMQSQLTFSVLPSGAYNPHASASSAYAEKQATDEQLNRECVMMYMTLLMDISDSTKRYEPTDKATRIETGRNVIYEMLIYAAQNGLIKPKIILFNQNLYDFTVSDDEYKLLGGDESNPEVTKAKNTLRARVDAIQPSGCTNVVDAVQETISYIRNIWKNKGQNRVRFYTAVVTDGIPDMGQDDIVVEKVKLLNLLAQFASEDMDKLGMKDENVSFQFIQLGTDPAATTFLQVLDNNLSEKHKHPDFARYMRYFAKYDVVDSIIPEQFAASGILACILHAFED